MSINTITNHGIFFLRMLDGLELITGLNMCINVYPLEEHEYLDFIGKPTEQDTLDFCFRFNFYKELP